MLKPHNNNRGVTHINYVSKLERTNPKEEGKLSGRTFMDKLKSIISKTWPKFDFKKR